MARFVPTDPTAAAAEAALAAEAVAALPEAAREVTVAVAAAVVALTEVPADPQQVLDAFATMRRGQAAIRAAEDRLLLRLHESGASINRLANSLSINRLTVERRLEAARAARHA